jgi:hypothetical protein
LEKIVTPDFGESHARQRLGRDNARELLANVAAACVWEDGGGLRDFRE